MIIYTIPFKYLLETIHRDLPSIALDYNYIHDLYWKWSLNSFDSLKLNFLILSVLAILVKEFILYILLVRQQIPNDKSSFLSKGIKKGVFSQTIYYLHYIIVWIVLTLLIFFSTDSNTILLLGINMGC